MRPSASQVLVLCYGNPGRLDDGLGPAFGEALEKEALPGVCVDVNYQLTVEDAALAARHDIVLFVDAAVCGREPFFLCQVQPRPSLGFTSHGAQPEAILDLTAVIAGAAPAGYALGIRGYEFNEFGETLSPGAVANLAAALQFIVPTIRRRDLRSAAAEIGGWQDPAQVTEG